MDDFDFYEEKITINNIDDYKDLIDSIRYICDFNGFDRNFDYKEDVLNPSLPENGKIENNFLIGFKEKITNKACFYISYYEKFMDDQVVFLGTFFEDRNFQGKGLGRKIYENLENKWILKGFSKIVLNVDLKNTKAVLFWINMGFKTVDFTFQCNEKNGEKFYMLRLSKNLNGN